MGRSKSSRNFKHGLFFLVFDDIINEVLTPIGIAPN